MNIGNLIHELRTSPVFDNTTLGNEAADMIESLQSENKQVHIKLRNSITRRKEQMAAADFAVASLKTERDTMRNALATFIEYNDNGGPLSFDVDDMWANARAALAAADGVQTEVDTLLHRVAELEQDRDEWKDSTIAANANAASEEKRRRAMQDERDTLRQQVAELEDQINEHTALCIKRVAEVTREREALRQQLAEAQALIEASRKQEPVDWITPDGDGFRIRFSKPVSEVSLGWDALYAAPVVAPDVLRDAERYRWLRNQYTAVDFAWNDSDKQAIIFVAPNFPIATASCDEVVDAAIGDAASND